MQEDDVYILTSEAHWKMQNLLWQIESITRLVGQNYFENINPSQQDALDVANCMDMVEEKLNIVQGLLDKRGGGRNLDHPKEEEPEAKKAA